MSCKALHAALTLCVLDAALYLMYSLIRHKNHLVDLLVWPLIVVLTFEIFEKQYLSFFSYKVKTCTWLGHFIIMGDNLYAAARIALHAVPAGDNRKTLQA